MSLLTDAIKSSRTTHCAVCGTVMLKHDAIDRDGEHFCSVLHEVEYAVTMLD
ncbi:hypothetical protein EDF24_3184 [Curtobacterium sp. PhB130]|uniref:hypothetical protein n=1 Tax=unclassified Curtobacterium TaxID=257496 RepID=UPI000FAE46D0|nr:MULTISPECIES: hypothetical protein [unclassified Curtobacterium]ROS74171.1 hypothetical protein EDF24_3184 [Curtobacterium sp. PhB130]TCK62987.1 hypothetical protein EDF27_2650 [Curtobacterium sp. PhB136]